MRPPLARGAWDRVRLGLEACACILVALVSLPQHGFAQAAADPSEAPTSVPGQVQRLSETRKQITLTQLPAPTPGQTASGATVPLAAEAAPTATAMPADPFGPKEQQPAEGQVQQLSETRTQIPVTPSPPPAPAAAASDRP